MRLSKQEIIAASEELQADASINRPEVIFAALKNIERRLASVEKNPPGYQQQQQQQQQSPAIPPIIPPISTADNTAEI